MHTLFRIALIILLIPFMTHGCGNRIQPKSNDRKQGEAIKQPKINGTRLVNPSDNQQFISGMEIPIRVARISDTVPDIDSMEFYIEGIRLYTAYAEPFDYAYRENELAMGRKSLRVIAYYADGRKEYHNATVIILSDIVPPYIPYRVTSTWPHDLGSYTQGLIYEDGYLYEGTGQWTESSLRKNIINTGEPERLLNLPDDVFGEGITIFNGKIYQLTYKSQVGFVYDKESFKRIQKVYYENKEGWGLTHDGENLIMSDGSHRIYFMDPEYFTEVRRIEVYNDKIPVNRLNELEFIEGRIFANIYGEEEIVIIDPATGKVTGKINMRGILPETDRHRRIDVFNGIAWNPQKRVLYVTGKYWPKLFEVSLQGEF